MPTYGNGPYGYGTYGDAPYASAVWPILQVEIDTTNEPTNPDRVWTDVTEYVRAANWVRDGRIAETERTAGGNATLVLDNRPSEDGEPFDKDNAASPYNAYGGLAWSFYIRISLTYAGTTHVQWTGTKDTLAKDRPGFGKDRIATLTAVTTTKAAELYLMLDGQDLAAAYADDRVTAMLALAQIPAGDIDTVTVSTRQLPDLVFSAASKTTALSHLQQVEQDERGLIFAQADGGISFQGCFYRADKVIDGPIATIGETDGDIRYVDGAPVDNNAYLWNVVAVTTTDADSTVSEATDTDSVTANYSRELDIQSLYDDPTLGLYEAEWYVNRYAAPPQRLPQLEVLGARDPSTWPTILAAGNSDLFTWEGAESTLSVFIERVSGAFSVAANEPRIRIYWDTSPSSRDYVWKLGVAGQSELAVTTRLG